MVNITIGVDDKTRALLVNLTTAIQDNTAALRASTTQGAQSMGTIADLTAVAQAVADDDGALKTAIDGLVTAFNTAVQGGQLSAADQAALDAAIQNLTNAHASLATIAADAAANPPVAP